MSLEIRRIAGVLALGPIGVFTLSAYGWEKLSGKKDKMKHKPNKYEFYKDAQGISHVRYTFWQGIEHFLTGIRGRIEQASELRPFLLRNTYRVPKIIDREWVLYEHKVGWNGGDTPYDFVVRVQLSNFVGEREPNVWDSILWAIDRTLPTSIRAIRLSCYTPDGYYIGDLKTAARIYYGWKLSEVQPFGVATEKYPEKYCKENNITCSIGFDEKNQKWVGWSHRAAGAFGVGYVVEEGNCEASSGWTDDYLEEHPEADLSMPAGFEVKTLEDAKRCAIAFAESVG